MTSLKCTSKCTSEYVIIGATTTIATEAQQAANVYMYLFLLCIIITTISSRQKISLNIILKVGVS